jgi:hypothetical protein
MACDRSVGEMPSPSPMRLYDGPTAIGEVLDYGPGKVLAFHLIEGRRVSLGFHDDRRAAREAIEARHVTRLSEVIRT